MAQSQKHLDLKQILLSRQSPLSATEKVALDIIGRAAFRDLCSTEEAFLEEQWQNYVSPFRRLVQEYMTREEIERGDYTAGENAQCMAQDHWDIAR